MSELYTVLHRFHDPDTVDSIGETLARNGIPYMVNDLSGRGGRTVAFDLQLQVKISDLERAEALLENFYGPNLLYTSEGYYLFNLANEELTEIVKNPARSSLFDYLLSREILRSRDVVIAPETIRWVQKQRFSEKLEAQSAPWWVFFAGYFFALAGGLIGLFIGWSIYRAKRTTLNDEKVPAFTKEDRQHGTAIIIISVAVILLSLYIKFRRQ